MSLTQQQITAADLMLLNIGIQPEDYIAAKQASSAMDEQEEVPVSPFLSRLEAATLLRCSTDTIDNLIAVGKIKSSKLSPARCGRVLVDRKSLLAFVRHRMARSVERA